MPMCISSMLSLPVGTVAESIVESYIYHAV